MYKKEYFEYEVEIDEKATSDWYAQSKGWACECGHCRNFIALAKARQLPAPVLAMLDDLGIPAEKATYVCEIYTDETGLIYEFSYRIAGTILKEGTPGCGVQSWGEVRCCHEPYPHGARGFATPHFDLEFWVTLPWVLEEDIHGRS